MKRKFEYVKGQKRVERLTDYYFWALEDLRAKLPFICERKQKAIGCIVGKGESYRGNANIGESGDHCQPWISPYLTMVLDEDKIANLGDLQGNTFCRNPDGDVAPWCIAPNGEFDYCDIPQCSSNEGSGILDDPNAVKCKADEFQCKTGGSECLLSAYVCDGYADCSNGADEDKCTGQDSLEDFAKHARKRLDVSYLERWLNTTTKACAKHCLKAEGFECRSFNYQAAKRLCILNEVNIGLSGQLEQDSQWDYYELRSKATNCEPSLSCKNGKCLTKDQICDGKFDCNGEPLDKTDEKSCVDEAKIKVRLVGGGSSQNEGWIEIKAFDYPYGGICDDGFNIEEANVICKMAGTLSFFEIFRNFSNIVFSKIFE
jgi:hypothetical protein